MQEGKHMPGPWHIEEDDGRFYVCHPGTVCTVTTICEIEPDGSRDVAADARLIAAAPDLLAALNGIVEAIEDCDEAEAIAIARTAIAKATGTHP